MSLSGIAKFFIGFLLGIALLLGAGAATAFYFWTKLSAEPSKPIFAEERAKASPVAKKTSSPTVRSPKQPTPAKASSKELPPGAYKARVSWAEGLILRDAPGADANRTGGVSFNQDVFVLKESDDQRWQKIRAADGELEGWIKAGNTQRVNE
jgi:hypothetical protein